MITKILLCDSSKGCTTIAKITEIIKYQIYDTFIKSLKMRISIYYLKKESTNSNLLKTCKSSIPSPTPIYFTGILN